jgi:4-hydroxy-2-oxoheptanedioate aldolase
MVQAESAQAIENIDAIAATEGVDVVFIGPADLSADMGYPGNPKHPDVVAAMDKAIEKIRAAGKAVGIIWFNPDDVRAYLAKGVTFMGVGGEMSILAKALRDTAKAFK